MLSTDMGVDVRSVRLRPKKQAEISLAVGANFAKAQKQAASGVSTVTELIPRHRLEEEAIKQTLPNYIDTIKIKLIGPNMRELRLALVKVEETSAAKMISKIVGS